MAGDDDEMFMTKSLNVTPKTTEQHLIVRSDLKSVAYVANNKRLRSTYCTIEARVTTVRHEALRGLFAIAELFVTKLVALQYSVRMPIDSITD